MDDSATDKQPNKRLLTTRGITILAVVVTVVLVAAIVATVFFAFRGGNGTIAGTDYADPSGLSIRVGDTTYLVVDDSNARVYTIVKVNDGNSATAQEVYKLSFTQGNYYMEGIRLLFVKESTLYFLEYSVAPRDGQSISEAYGTPNCELKSLDLRRLGSEPATIELRIKPGTSIPDWVISELGIYSDQGLSLEAILLRAAPDQEYAWFIYTDGLRSGKTVLFKFNCSNGEVECFEGDPVDAEEFITNPMVVHDDFIYFVHQFGVYMDSLSRASITNLDRELLVIYPTGAPYILASMRIVDGSLFYALFDPTSYSGFSRNYYHELHRFDLNTRKDTLLLSGESFGSYLDFAVYDGFIYYSTLDGIYRCDINGNNAKLFVGNTDALAFGRPCVSGDWLYFYSGDGGIWRIRLSGTGSPVCVTPQ